MPEIAASSVATPTRTAPLKALSFEPKNSDLVFVFFGLLYYALVTYTGFPFSTVLLRIITLNGVKLLATVLGLAAGITLLKALRYGLKTGWQDLKNLEVWRALSQPYFTLEFLSVTIRRIIVILGAIYLFLHLKHLILWWNKANYDQFLWDLDRKLHFGIQPNIWAMEKFGDNPDVSVLLDWLYIKYFNYKLIVATIFLMEPRGRKLSDQFFLAYALCWFLGGLLYVALPADGPAYAVLSEYSIPKENHFHVFSYPIVHDAPASYVKKYVDAKIHIAKIYQEKLWVDRQVFFNGKALPGVFYGIAAMPSLHNAAVMMLMIFLYQVSGPAAIFGLVYVVTTFLGSIFLQWHYAVDGYVGWALAIAICIFSLKTPAVWPILTRRLGKNSGPELNHKG